MKLLTSFLKRISSFFRWFLARSRKVKIVSFIVLAGLIWFLGTRLPSSKSSQPQYQTTKAEKGTLIVTVSSSGQVSSANTSPITTKASGIVTNVYLKDGDEV